MFYLVQQHNLLSQQINYVRLHVHDRSYWKAIGHFLSFSVLISIIVMQFSRNMIDWWLSRWVTSSENGNATNLSYVKEPEMLDEDNNMRYYMMIYILLACLNSVFTLFRAFLFALGGITAASTIHKGLLKSIMQVW